MNLQNCVSIVYLRHLPAILIAGALAASLSCGGADMSKTEGDLLLKEEPQGALDVLAARKDAKDQQEITVIGRIGGRVDPWIKSLAAFSIVDRSLTPCSEMEGDTCPTPWDYCCEPDLAAATVLVTFVDDQGQVIKQSAREVLPVEELSTVVVQGKAKRDDAGNVTILASKAFVKNDDKATP
jgi:hypothetical protein